ncbi:TolC family protein [Alkaliphilus serpentinus]|uniref:TolC family protein n=1 Tax=Alkaliphilus serpentinus TaxID=1482731 RepID=A0A833HR47_9FIRM|nr:TolC family protein [Alkaliphilus serpentinus]KAB3532728.1 TolC family protein [Alkaliphilus serpentinus]
MKSIRIKLTALLVLVMLVSSTVVIEAVEPMGLEELTKVFLEENFEIQKLGINERLLKLRYEETLEDYEDLQKSVENARKYKESMEQQRKDAREEYLEADSDSAEGRVAHGYLHSTLHMLEAAEESYKALVKQEANMMKSLELMVLEEKQATRKRQQETEKLKYQLSNNYYQLLMMKEQQKIIEGNIDLLDMQIRLEKTRKSLELTTDLAVNSLESQRSNLLISLEKLQNSMEMAKEALKTDLNMTPEEELNLTLELTEDANLKSYELSAILEGFMSNNLAIETSKTLTEVQQKIVEKLLIAYEETDTDYQIGLLELEEAQLNHLILERSYEHMVKQAFYNHRQVGRDLVSKIEGKLLADEKMKQVEAQYSSGLISSLQYNSQKQELVNVQFEYLRTAIDYIRVDYEIQLIQKGILTSSR